MNIKYGASAILVAVMFTMPLTVQADRGNGRDNNSEDCYEHKGKHKCRDNNDDNKRKKHKHKHKHGDKHTAGGPPPWAPAHGRHKKSGHYGSGYNDDYFDKKTGAHVVVTNGAATVDVGIQSGSCNREAIGTVVGGVVGGVIGNRVGDMENREVATVVGVIIGGLVGNNIGKSMDKADQHCTGQALEQAADNQTVRWTDQETKGEYRVTPERTYQSDGQDCRDFTTEYQYRDRVKRENSTACRNTEGAWKKITM